MPNLIGPLLPTFGVPQDYKSMVKKIDQYVLGYASGVTIAKVLPRTAAPIGILLGLQLAPGKGIQVRRGSLLLLHAPQPIGVMPPHYYHLPDIMADPVELAEILTAENARQKLRERVDADYAKRAVEQQLAAQQSVRDLTNYQRQLFDQLATGQVPTPPTPEQLFGFDKLTPLEQLQAAVNAGFDPVVQVEQNGRVEFVNLVSGQVVVPPAGLLDDGGAGTVIGQIQTLQEFTRNNPPDP